MRHYTSQEGTMPATVQLSGNPDIDGLLWGYKWVSVFPSLQMTYSFPASANEYTGYDGFEAFNDAQKTAVTNILANIDHVCRITFTLTTGANATLRFAEASSLDYGGINDGVHTPGGQNNSAEGNAPDPTRYPSYAWGDCWFNHTDYNTPKLGTHAFSAGLMHEIGHALGLKHGHNTQETNGTIYPKLPEDHNSFEYSVMTYHQYVGEMQPGDSAFDHPTTLMMDDIAALQYLYGADYTHNSGDNMYRWSPLTGQLFIDGLGQGASDHNCILMTIWDGGGNDTYDFSNYNTDLRVDLSPGGWTTTDPAQLANLGTTADPHSARGNIANALLYQNNPASLIENAIGGSGDDDITGNAANNSLFGGAGKDTIHGGLGNDTLDGGTGADLLVGGMGNDIFYVDDFGDQVVEGPWFGGIDTAYASINYVLAGNVEALVLTGNASIGTGNYLNNSISGTVASNLIDGGAGQDSLAGLGGDDTFVFQAGEAGGDVVIDFEGNGNGAGDSLMFMGYGPGASFVQVDSTHWLIESALFHEVITFQNAASIHATDVMFA